MKIDYGFGDTIRTPFHGRERVGLVLSDPEIVASRNVEGVKFVCCLVLYEDGHVGWWGYRTDLTRTIPEKEKPPSALRREEI